MLTRTEPAQHHRELRDYWFDGASSDEIWYSSDEIWYARKYYVQAIQHHLLPVAFTRLDRAMAALLRHR